MCPPDTGWDDQDSFQCSAIKVRYAGIRIIGIEMIGIKVIGIKIISNILTKLKKQHFRSGEPVQRVHDLAVETGLWYL